MSNALVGNTHLIAGNAETIRALQDFLKKNGIETRGSADAYVRVYKQFGADDARSLRERAGLRAQGEQRVFIVCAPSMTTEAQNILLKTLEEPHGGALFFFIVPSPQTLLATIRSRSQVLALPYKEVNTSGENILDAKTFLAASSQKRLDMLKPLLEKDEDDKRDIGNIIGFLSSLERMLLKKPQGLHAVYRARKYIGDKGALVKPLLEQIALLAPKV